MTADVKPKRSGIWIAILPLAIFLGLAALFYSLLSTEGRNTSQLPSALLNEPAPTLVVPELQGSNLPGIGADTLKGKISIVNVFASWCVPCRQEHPQIVALGNDDRFQVIGLNHKDSTDNALGFLAELGNPYDVIGVDRNGRASIEWGVYGVPETFFVNQDGVIFHKHVGPISPVALKTVIMPLLEEQLGGAS